MLTSPSYLDETMMMTPCGASLPLLNRSFFIDCLTFSATPQVQQRERKNVYLIEDFSSNEEEDDTYDQGTKRETRRTRRLNRRTDGGTMNIFDARKRMLLESKKTPLERDNARRIANLGPGGCPACMSNPCKRVPVVNVEVGAQGRAVCTETCEAQSPILQEYLFARNCPQQSRLILTMCTRVYQSELTHCVKQVVWVLPNFNFFD